MTMRLIFTAALALAVSGGMAIAQGTTAPRAPGAHVPHHKVTPAHKMQHPRAVPEPQTVDALNAMSLSAAQKGQNFMPPAPGNEHEKAAGMGMTKQSGMGTMKQ